MGFVLEFAENLIRWIMDLRRGTGRTLEQGAHRCMKAWCEKIKEMWALPIRPYGFWTFERHNAQLARDTQISNATGRPDPYDDLLLDNPK